ncbi:hypothetical protein KMP13_01845 [Epibacterium ulvae]|uniref:hypothetical protein n=1 Tax=Epibacterium ulvae TaxID=1156985 RepID=UPI001BFC9C14|nr:hypothetical protein [Epibacterium ulvae]MBT8152659.1 hypothetical protein [Epibacterium ulvae]
MNLKVCTAIVTCWFIPVATAAAPWVTSLEDISGLGKVCTISTADEHSTVSFHFNRDGSTTIVRYDKRANFYQREAATVFMVDGKEYSFSAFYNDKLLISPAYNNEQPNLERLIEGMVSGHTFIHYASASNPFKFRVSLSGFRGAFAEMLDCVQKVYLGQ